MRPVGKPSFGERHEENEPEGGKSCVSGALDNRRNRSVARVEPRIRFVAPRLVVKCDGGGENDPDSQNEQHEPAPLASSSAVHYFPALTA